MLELATGSRGRIAATPHEARDLPSWCGRSSIRQRSALDPGQEGAGERLGVGERHHVAGVCCACGTCRRTTSRIPRRMPLPDSALT